MRISASVSLFASVVRSRLNNSFPWFRNSLVTRRIAMVGLENLLFHEKKELNHVRKSRRAKRTQLISSEVAVGISEGVCSSMRLL